MYIFLWFARFYDVNVGFIPAVEEYDPVIDKWTKKASEFIDARNAPTSCIVNDRIYIIGEWLLSGDWDSQNDMIWIFEENDKP